MKSRIVDLVREFFALTGSILFLIGAVAIVIDGNNHLSPPIYIACACCYVMSGVVGFGYATYRLIFR